METAGDLGLASTDNGIFWSNEPCWRHALVFAAAPLVVAVTGAGGTSPEHRGQWEHSLQHRVTDSLTLRMDTMYKG